MSLLTSLCAIRVANVPEVFVKVREKKKNKIKKKRKRRRKKSRLRALKPRVRNM